ncbi:hypothetical protein [Pendulispora albinea]|uniref:Uncharacterized protein n=1 Tax=Pendulispora albinea TaxID=2741071 RepID=A0ABZ2LXK6_9BACT
MRKMAFRLAALVTLSGLAGLGGAIAPFGMVGCASILGLENTTLGSDPDVSGDGFVVRQTTGWIAADGGYVTWPSKLASQDITVSVRNGTEFVASELRSQHIVDGTTVGLNFGSPAPGERYVAVQEGGIRTIYVVKGNHLDLGFDAVGRHDAVQAAAGLRLTAKGVSATDGGENEPESFLGGSLTLPLGKLAGTPPAWTIAQGSSAGPLRLLDRAKGDVAWVKREGPVAPSFLATVEGCTFPEQFQMLPGSEAHVEVTCGTAPKRSVSLRTSLEAFRNLVASAPEPDSAVVTLVQIPPGHRVLREQPATRVMGDLVGHGPVPLDAAPLDFDFVDPALPDWPLVATARIEFESGGAAPFQTSFKVSRALRDGPLAPLVGPVRGVSIGTSDLLQPGAKIVGVGYTPTIVLVPPDTTPPLRAPTSYRLGIMAFDDRDGGPAGGFEFVTEIVTRGTEVVLPPGVVQAGKTHLLTVTAQYTESYSEEEPLRGRLPSGETTITTNVFAP